MSDILHSLPGGTGDGTMGLLAMFHRAACIIFARKDVYADLGRIDKVRILAKVIVYSVIVEIAKKDRRPACRVYLTGFLTKALWLCRAH